MPDIEQLKQVLLAQPEIPFSTAWIQRRWRVGYWRASALRDEALQCGLVVKVHRDSATGGQEYGYVLPGRELSQDMEWFTVTA